jgi:hypothetical protein
MGIVAVKTATLRGSGISVVFDRLGTDAEVMTFDIRVLGDRYQVRIPARKGCVMSGSDLAELAMCVRQHVGGNYSHDFEESPAFFTDELDFELQCLDGEIESWSDGEFTIRFMLQVGRSLDEGRVYAGFEFVVSVEDALRWCGELDALGGRDQ